MTKRKKRTSSQRRDGARQINRFDGWLRKFVEESDDALIRGSEGILDSFLHLAKDVLPSKYGWRVMSADAFIHQGQKLQAKWEVNGLDPEAANRLYWHDAARSIEAYEVLSVWRGAELLEAALVPLNTKRVLAPAIIARSILELAVCFLYNANVVEKITGQVVEVSPDRIAVSEEIEDLLLKGLWGTRLGEPPEHIKQVNVLTRIQFLSRNPHANALLPAYEYLCEIAHPNVIGNARFQAAGGEPQEDGSVLLRIERDAEFLAATQIREKTIWALAWSAYCLRSGREMLMKSVAQILTRWPPEPVES